MCKNKILVGFLATAMLLAVTACQKDATPDDTVSVGETHVTTELQELQPGEVSVSFTPDNSASIQEAYQPYLEYIENIRVKCEKDIAALPCSDELKKQVEAKPEVLLDFMKDNPIFIYTRSQNGDKTFIRFAYTKDNQPYSELFTFLGGDHELKCENVDELVCFLSGGYYSA